MSKPSEVFVMWRLNVGIAIFLSAALWGAAAAQGGGQKRRRAMGTKTRAGAAPEALTLEQQYALGVLEQLLSSLKEVEDEGLRVRTQAQAADILWGYDEPRARGLFREAFEAAGAAKLEGRKDGA